MRLLNFMKCDVFWLVTVLLQTDRGYRVAASPLLDIPFISLYNTRAQIINGTSMLTISLQQ